MKYAIAMKCTKEQFESIEPKLKGLEVKEIFCFDYLTYLVNNLSGRDNLISNTSIGQSGSHDRKVFEEWNEQTFLDACGLITEIENEKVYQLTREQLKSLTQPKTDIEKVLNEWCPGYNDLVLEVGKWYKSASYLICKQNGENCFGFYLPNMKWIKGVEHKIEQHLSAGYFEATEEEVREALGKEAVKRGFVEGVYIKKTGINEKFNMNFNKIDGGFNFSLKRNVLDSGNGYGYIFKDGVWAEIEKTKTRAEAEKELNCKIID